jgi:hypothetical protein
MNMIETIPRRIIVDNRTYTIEEYKRDRQDIYRAFERYEDPLTTSTIIKYKIQSVQRCPDYDW